MAFADGFLSPGRFVLVIVGLVMAELMNLFLGDWAAYRRIDLSRGKATPPPPIEGSPTLPVRLLPLRYTLHAAIACAIPAIAVFLYFAWQLGWVVWGIMGFSLIAGGFYVAPPFRYAFFSTAFLPPVIAFGVYFVLSGFPDWEMLLPALPLSFVSAGVIFTYRVIYDPQGVSRFEANRRYLSLFYGACYLALLVLVLSKVVTPWALLAFSGMPLLFIIRRVTFSERDSYLPATALGVLLHSVTGLLIALGYVISGLS